MRDVCLAASKSEEPTKIRLIHKTTINQRKTGEECGIESPK